MEQIRERLDILLVEKGFFNSRERARENILKGNIFVDGEVVKKCGRKIPCTCNLEFKGEPLKYVSRGGLKLEKALESFSISLKDKVCSDIGASTGGFTHCMLLNGATKVFALDVGKDQLHETLRKNHKVVSYEETNVKELHEEFFGEMIDFISIDVSFISLTKVLPYTLKVLRENGEIVALIKPQFEAGKKFLNKKGVVKDKKVHEDVVFKVWEFCSSLDLKIADFEYSPVKGPNGNIEYLIYLIKNKEEETIIPPDQLLNKVEEAFNCL